GGRRTGRIQGRCFRRAHAAERDPDIGDRPRRNRPSGRVHRAPRVRTGLGVDDGLDHQARRGRTGFPSGREQLVPTDGDAGLPRTGRVAQVLERRL
ncbi:MAG: hypothetical protein AVDCRST_MAG04-1634, partial [uncultured Acetobacteraceae bacterium]